MTEMENNIAGEIMQWAFDKYQGVDNVSHKEMVDTYWKHYFNSCTMGKEFTGLEMPHEEDLSYTYYPNADEYNSRHGW